MITLNIPPQALHNAFRVENTVDLRELALGSTGTEVMWLLVPVCVSGQKLPAQPLSDEAPTRLEFAPTAAR